MKIEQKQPEKTAKKPKPAPRKRPKTFEEYKLRADERKMDGLTACLTVLSNPSDESLLKVQKAFASFLGYKQYIAIRWNADGTENPPPVPVEGYTGQYMIRAFIDESGQFKGQIFYWRNNDRKDCVVIADTTGHQTEDSAKKVCWMMAEGLGIKKRIRRHFRIYFEGDIDIEDEKSRVATMRQESAASITSLIMAGRKASPEESDTLIADVDKKLQRWMTATIEFKRHWNDEGKWIGRKKKKPKTQKVEVVQE